MNAPLTTTLPRVLLLTLSLTVASRSLAEPRTPIPLWPNGAPGALGFEDKDKPTVTPYLPENSLNFAAALRQAGVPFALHVYERGPHGLSLGNKPPFENPLAWARERHLWLREHRFVGTPNAQPSK
jgi:acetyl esterase/lipase